MQGCIVGVGYFACMTFLVQSPVELIAAQVLNAWFFASLEGVGLNLFQQIIARPGIASSLFTYTVQLGGVAAGPLIAIAGASALGYRGVFAGAGALTVIGIAFIGSQRSKDDGAVHRNLIEDLRLRAATRSAVRTPPRSAVIHTVAVFSGGGAR
jgi:MFS family permease